MLARDLLSDEIPSLSPNDSGDTALRWMDEYKLTHLCVVDGVHFLGTISENDILGLTDIGESIKTNQDQFNTAFIRKDQHIFEAIKMVHDHDLSIIPVLDIQGPYVGCISISKLMDSVASLPMVNNPGATIVLELSLIDFSLQVISGIIEENNARILGTYVQDKDDSALLELTIKLNISDSSAIISSLQRHDFKVVYHENDQKDNNNLKDRYDALMNFLKV